MHKEAQQAAGGPTSLGATSKEGAHPQLSSDISKTFLTAEKVPQGKKPGAITRLRSKRSSKHT
nr:hypothetical protein [Tanacetum cinerariifolium]